jgi:Mrp family chromosome partitioning ATPase/capsular polysaccharide biosynthesis protein
MPDDWTFRNDGEPNASWRPRRLFGVASLLRHRRLIGLFGASFLMGGVLFALARPVTYTASTQLLIYNRELIQGPESVILPGRADTPLLENAIEIFRSRRVLTRLIVTLRLDEDMEFTSDGPLLWRVARGWFAASEDADLDEHRLAFEHTLESIQRRLTISRVGNSNTILVNFSSSDPNKAALIANGIVKSASQTLTNADATPGRMPLLRERLQGLGPNAYAISAADPPTHPDGPRLLLVVMAASLAGLGLGAIFALFRDFRDGTIRTPEQAEYFLDLECLGVIPRVQNPPAHPSQMKKPADEPRGPSNPRSAKFTPDGVTLDRLSRAQVVIDSIRHLKTIGVTSAVSGEGATFVVRNLAQLSARHGKSVLIVDGSGRNRPASYLVSEKERRPSARRSGRSIALGARCSPEKGPGVDILLIEEPSAPESDAAYWRRIDEALRQSASSYDLVIADLPALVSDSQVAPFASQTLEGLLLVVKWGGTDAEMIRRRLGPPGATRSKFVGVVLNMADQQLLRGYGDKLTEAEAALTALRPVHATRVTGLAGLTRA